MIRSNAVALSLLAVLAAGPLAAQNTAVPGFDGGIRWGAAKEEVNTFWREDPAAESREGSISMIAYKPWQQMNWTVYVDDARGLIGAGPLASLNARIGTLQRQGLGDIAVAIKHVLAHSAERYTSMFTHHPHAGSFAINQTSHFNSQGLNFLNKVLAV